MERPGIEPALTRSQFLRAAGGAAAGLLLAGPDLARAGASAHRISERPRTFRSRPNLQPPQASIQRGPAAASGAREGYWFLTAGGNAPNLQTGPVILDHRGRPIWFKAMRQGWFAFNLRVQTYRGQPVLTWWEGSILGNGEAVIMDTSYREIARVRAARSTRMSLCSPLTGRR